jgi:hypothetical protein
MPHTRRLGAYVALLAVISGLSLHVARRARRTMRRGSPNAVTLQGHLNPRLRSNAAAHCPELAAVDCAAVVQGCCSHWRTAGPPLSRQPTVSIYSERRAARFVPNEYSQTRSRAATAHRKHSAALFSSLGPGVAARVERGTQMSAVSYPRPFVMAAASHARPPPLAVAQQRGVPT